MNHRVTSIEPGDAASWFDVASLDDIPLRGSRRVTAGLREVALFRIHDEEVFAIDNACPHRQGPLSEGIVHGDCVTCPLHNWVISLRDGKAQGADEGRVSTHPVRVINNRILVQLTT